MGWINKQFYLFMYHVSFGKKKDIFKNKYKNNDEYCKMIKNINNIENSICNIENCINNIEYEVFDVCKNKNIKIPNVMSIDETIDDIINNRKSVCRYGDGEFTTLIDKSNDIYYKQKRNIKLVNKLRLILKENRKGLIVCIWDYFGNLDDYNDYYKKIARMHMNNLRMDIYMFLDMNKIYGNAFISRPYIIYKDKSKSNYYFNKIKKIWENQDVVVIEGVGTRLGVGNDLFNNAKSVLRVLCPAESAFDKYDEILSYVRELPQNRLYLIALGMTATVLAYDMYMLGYWAIDIGHIDIEYEWFRMKAENPVPVKNKYVNEVGKFNIESIKDDVYENSILKIIN